MQHVEIKGKDGITKVWVDGKELKRVLSISFNQSVDTIPEVNIEIVPVPDMDIDIMARVNVDVFTIEQAAVVVQNAYKANRDFRESITESIESAMRESTIVLEDWEYKETAKKIADRVFGE